jgi:hypothetical protein
MKTLDDAKQAVIKSWPKIKEDCLSVLGSELHYQAMIYHALREHGKVPISQIGMNVKMWIRNPISELFQTLDKKKHKDYQGGFEPIPDIVIFRPSIEGDWRRRNNNQTLTNMFVAIEVKASERANKRLSPSEISLDIRKLAAHREEVIAKGTNMLPIMLIIDSAHSEKERMTQTALNTSEQLALALDVSFLYISPEKEIYRI